jgi:hypothetical protein
MRGQRALGDGRRMVRVRQGRGLQVLSRRVARRSADSHGMNVAVCSRGRPRVVLVWHICLGGNASTVGVLWWHAVVRLGTAVGHVSVHVGVHLLLMVLRRILRVVVRRRAGMGVGVSVGRGTSPSRPLVAMMNSHVAADNRRRPAGHVNDSRRHARRRYTLGQRHVLPSRQMAVTHPAGLGFSFEVGCRPAVVRRPVLLPGPPTCGRVQLRPLHLFGCRRAHSRLA